MHVGDLNIESVSFARSLIQQIRNHLGECVLRDCTLEIDSIPDLRVFHHHDEDDDNDYL